MPTHGDETLSLRYQREHDDNLARLAKLTPEQVAGIELNLHNALAELDALQKLLGRCQERLNPHRDAVLWGDVCAAFASRKVKP